MTRQPIRFDDGAAGFDSFDDFCNVSTATGAPRATLDPMKDDVFSQLKEQVRARLPVDGQGRITVGGTANAIKGHVPWHRR